MSEPVELTDVLQNVHFVLSIWKKPLAIREVPLDWAIERLEEALAQYESSVGRK